MNILKPLTTPEYLFRPSQILHRLRWSGRRQPPDEFTVVPLPWGDRIRVRPHEVIGANICCYGVFDLVVTETICRLLDLSETALDIGANIGQMTSMMRHKAGAPGKVIAFEPHPELFAELQYNAETLAPPDGGRRSQVQLHRLALGEEPGEAFLDVGPVWSSNRGMSKVVGDVGTRAQSLIPVKVARLDTVLNPDTQVHFCKMDVEGFELKVLQGASGLLRRKAIRDLVFEDFEPYPTPVHRMLQEHGFAVFSLHSNLFGPRLAPVERQESFAVTRDGQNYLATLEPQRALTRFRRRGWAALR